MTSSSSLAIPETGLNTKEARAVLPESLPRAGTIRQASRAAALVLGLMNAERDLIEYGMDDQIAVPLRKGMILGYDAAVEAGVAAGAYGVTISGSGSALIAVTGDDRKDAVAEALADALSDAGNPSAPLTPDVSERGVGMLE